jgi:hypothetical protein
MRTRPNPPAPAWAWRSPGAWSRRTRAESTPATQALRIAEDAEPDLTARLPLRSPPRAGRRRRWRAMAAGPLGDLSDSDVRTRPPSQDPYVHRRPAIRLFGHEVGVDAVAAGRPGADIRTGSATTSPSDTVSTVVPSTLGRHFWSRQTREPFGAFLGYEFGLTSSLVSAVSCPALCLRPARATTACATFEKFTWFRSILVLSHDHSIVLRWSVQVRRCGSAYGGGRLCKREAARRLRPRPNSGERPVGARPWGLARLR